MFDITTCWIWTTNKYKLKKLGQACHFPLFFSFLTTQQWMRTKKNNFVIIHTGCTLMKMEGLCWAFIYLNFPETQDYCWSPYKKTLSFVQHSVRIYQSIALLLWNNLCLPSNLENLFRYYYYFYHDIQLYCYGGWKCCYTTMFNAAINWLQTFFWIMKGENCLRLWEMQVSFSNIQNHCRFALHSNNYVYKHLNEDKWWMNFDKPCFLLESF